MVEQFNRKNIVMPEDFPPAPSYNMEAIKTDLGSIRENIQSMRLEILNGFSETKRELEMIKDELEKLVDKTNPKGPITNLDLFIDHLERNSALEAGPPTNLQELVDKKCADWNVWHPPSVYPSSEVVKGVNHRFGVGIDGNNVQLSSYFSYSIRKNIDRKTLDQCFQSLCDMMKWKVLEELDK